MKKYSLSLIFILTILLTLSAQNIIVTGGPGRVNNTTVYKGLPFTARVTGLNGTPQRWTVGIGTVNGRLISNSSSTTISNAIVDRTISGSTALISVGATNGNGVSRFLTAINQPATCTSRISAFADGCVVANANMNPPPSGFSNISWSVSPSGRIVGNGTSVLIFNLNPSTFYRVTAVITGGNCGSQTITGTFRTGNCDGPLPRNSSNLNLSPNPVEGNELNIQFDGEADSFKFNVFSNEGQLVDDLIKTEKQDGEATLNVGKLNPGIYYIKSINENGDQEILRFIIN